VGVEVQLHAFLTLALDGGATMEDSAKFLTHNNDKNHCMLRTIYGTLYSPHLSQQS